MHKLRSATIIKGPNLVTTQSKKAQAPRVGFAGRTNGGMIKKSKG